MNDFKIYEVGGCIRDDLLGIPTNDIDYTVVGPQSFEEMHQKLIDMGFIVFKADEAHFTVRAHFPKNMDYFAGRAVANLTADFVLARKESGYSDGRHPDNVTVGTLYQDLRRRDFSCNAVAMDEQGNYIDPFNGVQAIRSKTLIAVGGAERSFTDDALRVMRALRFSLTKNFYIDMDIYSVFHARWLPKYVANISFERRMEELDKMFKFDSVSALNIIANLPIELQKAILAGYRLTTTSKKR